MYLGIDVGTTGTKTLLVNQSGEIVTSGYSAYPLLTSSGRIEQEPTSWKKAVINTVNKCLQSGRYNKDVRAIGFSFQSGTMLPVDNNYEALAPAVLWIDNTATNQSKELLKNYGQDFFYEKTGWRLSGSFNLAQIIKMQEERPKLFAETKYFAHVSDYLLSWFCGIPAVDYTAAGNSMIFNIKQKDWDQDLLNIAGIERENLGFPTTPGAYIGHLKPSIAEELKLNNDVKIFAGAQDQFCSALAIGAINKHDLLMSTGTSWVMMIVNDEILKESDTYPGFNNHLNDDLYVSYLYTPTGGSALNWFRQTFSPSSDNLVSYSEIDKLAVNSSIGSKGITFINRLAGTLYPSWEIEGSGSFVGIRLEHAYSDFARAVMEGVACEYAWMLESIENSYQKNLSNNMFALGGATRSNFWMQIVANICNKTLLISKQPDLAPLGAAILAAVGAGDFVSQQEALQVFAPEYRRIEPNPNELEAYREVYQNYKQIASSTTKL